jgi:hypothetical protein
MTSAKRPRLAMKRKNMPSLRFCSVLLRVTLVIAFLLVTSPGASLAVPPGPVDEVGWYAGDQHVHSIYSVDAYYLKPTTNAAVTGLADAARDIGLSWIIVTDHSNVNAGGLLIDDPRLPEWFSGWYDASLFNDGRTQAQLSSIASFKTLYGQEMGAAQSGQPAHYLSYNTQDYVPNPVRPGGAILLGQVYVDYLPATSDTGSVIIQRVNDHGGFGFLAHPFSSDNGVWIGTFSAWESWPSQGYAGLEIWSDAEGRLKWSDQQALSKWYDLLNGVQAPSGGTLNARSGFPNAFPVGIGNSDAHSTNAVGQVFTYCWMSSLSQGHITGALLNGRCVASNGPLGFLTVAGKKPGEVATVAPGQNTVYVCLRTDPKFDGPLSSGHTGAANFNAYVRVNGGTGQHVSFDEYEGVYSLVSKPVTINLATGDRFINVEFSSRSGNDFGELAWHAFSNPVWLDTAGAPELLSAPTLTSPANASTGQSLTPSLTWSSVPNATSYRVLVATNPSDLTTDPTEDTFPNVIVNETPTTNSLSVPAGHLSPGTTYYWEVKGRNASQYGEWSAKWSFTTAPASTPAIGLNPTSLSPSAVQGSNASSQQFTVRNAGPGTLTYGIADDQSWMSVTPISGTSSGEEDTITVTYTTSGLSAGTYSGEISVAATGASNTPQHLPVTLTIGGPATYTISGTVTFNGSGLSGVKMNSLPNEPLTNSSGFYSDTVPDGFADTVRPSKSGYTFSPPSKPYSTVHANQTGQNYTADQQAAHATATVTLTPQGANDAGAGWRLWYYLDGECKGFNTNWNASGDTSGLFDDKGYDYKLEYRDIDGWHTPPDQWFTPAPGQTYTFTGAYIRCEGTVITTINPASARSAGAQWRIDAGSWRDSGYPEQHVSVGMHTVEFKSISGWLPPNSRLVSVADLETSSLSVDYIEAGTTPKFVYVTPNSGPVSGGTSVTISGANFGSPASVTFGTTSASQVTVASDTEIHAVAPPAASTGSVNITVGVPAGTVTATTAFTYLSSVGQNMTMLGQIGGSTYAVAAQGNYAYIGEGPTFKVLNVSTPSSPAPVGSLLLQGLIRHITIVGTRAYVAASDRGVYILNIATPSSPSFLGVYDTAGSARCVKVSGALLYVADGSGGLCIINAGNPQSPVLVSSLPLPESAVGLDVAGGFVYAAIGYSGLQIVDVSTPSQPTLRGRYDSPGQAMNVTLVGNYAYLADYDGGSQRRGLEIVNVSNPDVPTLQASPLLDPERRAVDVKIISSINRAYVVEEGYANTTVLDISNVASPSQIGAYTCYPGCKGYCSKLDVLNGNAYLACTDGGLGILNVSAPSSITLRSTYSAGLDYAKAIDANATHAFVRFSYGMRIVDVTNPTSPQMRGADNGDAGGYNLVVEDNFLYTPNFSQGLRMLDVSNPMQPLLRGTYGGGASSVPYLLGVNRYGGWTYALGFDTTTHGWVRILDTSNPSSPFVRGRVETGLNEPQDVAFSGSYAYVADENGLSVINIANTAAPVLVASLNIAPSMPRSVATMNDHVYAACWPNVLSVNVANPSAPFVEHTYNSPNARHIRIKDQLAFVSTGPSGVEVLDLANAGFGSAPVASYDTAGSAEATAVVGNHVYVADGTCGLAILESRDVRPPSVTIDYPTSLQTWTTTSSSFDLSGSAADSTGIVQVAWSNHRGGNGLAEDWGNWENWYVPVIALQPGTNVITVTATDAEGNIGSDTITITYNAPPDTENPQVVITNPSSPTYTSNTGTMTVSGTASDNAGVSQVIWSNNRGGTGNAVGTLSWAVSNIVLKGGENVITITAIDTSGNLGTDVVTVTYPDADGDGVGNDVDVCPGTVPGMIVDAEGCPPPIPGDFNRDGDVDPADLDAFAACALGPGIPQLAPNCAGAKLDEDDDVDQNDFGILQRCLSGENVAADPSCGN